MFRQTPLESLTFRNKDTPTLKPTGRYRENSEEVASVLAANQLDRQDGDEGMEDDMDEEWEKEYDDEGQEDDEAIEAMSPEEAERERLIKKMQSAKKHKYQATINDQILFDKINYIDLEGKSHPDTPLSKVLKSFAKEKKKYVLVLVQPKTATCRLFLTKDYAEHVKKARLTAQQNRITVKQLQLTWNIGDNDLMYRLQRAAKLLEQGCRLDIILGSRKAKLVRDRGQRDEMLAKIRETFAPYGYEWRTMSGGFPNAELWFQGYSEKVKRLKADEIAAKEARVLQLSTEGERSIAETDDLNLSNEEYQPGSFKVRERRDVLREADEEYEKLFPERVKNAATGMYWEELVTSSTTGNKDTSLTENLTQSKMNTSNVGSANEKEKKDKVAPSYDDLKAEFDGSLDPAKLKQQRDAQAKLQSMATRFAKIGSKSMFGRKLSSK
jgi:translation initiation factor IF-3